MAQTTKLTHLASPEKRSHNFLCRLQRAEGIQRVWHMPGLVEGGRTTLSPWDVKSHSMVSAAHETVAWNKEELKQLLKGTHDTDHGGHSWRIEPGQRGASVLPWEGRGLRIRTQLSFLWINFRITESARLEKTFKIITSNCSPALLRPPLTYVTEGLIYAQPPILRNRPSPR